MLIVLLASISLPGCIPDCIPDCIVYPVPASVNQIWRKFASLYARYLFLQPQKRNQKELNEAKWRLFSNQTADWNLDSSVFYDRFS